MTLKTEMASDISTFINTGEFAEAVTYTPYGGSPVSRSAIVDREALHEEGHHAGFRTAVIRMYIASDATNGVTSVGYRDTVAITNPAGSAENWRVHPEMEAIETDGFWEIVLIRDARPHVDI